MINPNTLERYKQLEEQFKEYTDRQLSFLNMAINEDIQKQLVAAKAQQIKNSRKILVNRTIIWCFGFALAAIVTIIVNLHFKG